MLAKCSHNDFTTNGANAGQEQSLERNNLGAKFVSVLGTLLSQPGEFIPLRGKPGTQP